MFIDAETLEDKSIFNSDIAVVGAGPAGIVTALELAKSGYEVALIESGRLDFSEAIQKLGEASYYDPKVHAPMTECTRRQVGGTSIIWGGRCLPYDPVDFDKRDYIPYSSWPVTYEELEPYFQKACDYFFCGKAEFDINNISTIKQKSIVPGLPDEETMTSTLERWSLPTNFGKEYHQELKQYERIKLLYGLTCTEIETNDSGNQVEVIQAKTLGGKTIRIKAEKFILAGGALNSTRLLLASDKKHPGGIGNHSGLLGRFYMGHLSGDIATVRFTTPPQETVFGFDRDSDNIYLRRRFSFTREFLHEKQLTNIVAWLGSPKFNEPSHGNGILSLAYLALTAPVLGNYLTSTAIKNSLVGKDKAIYQAHLMNVLKDFGKLVSFIPNFAYGRFVAKRKIPALFVYSAANEYPLHYHSEQIPNFDSTVSLSNDTDELGMRRLNIDLRCTPQDIDSVVRAHQYWDEHLRKHGCGYLKYLTDDPEASVWEQAGDGFHQVGTTRMSENPSDGVVGKNCNIHGVDNLFVASSSNFVTSGQANSTFMIVVFALKLVDHLKANLSSSVVSAPGLTENLNTSLSKG
ncbi:GMC family oxidoreductase [Phormidium sp. LEGE 05292]|uniref:FAD-dependent oxidoreductase n=1 Tax=[Phormidium] sp. LEGE 05292 TaxID=767427 RepID=UPI00187F6E0B|nr:FAD-dependent oxidoreductase [Phormidium sp. LEGE 05292]MBE9228704.1 GMC family oxidoreductase [Phormidium sp. LEGE 05292]